MKTIRTILTCLVLALGASIPATARFATADIRDLALVYQGGTMRIDWTPDQLEPYVTHVFRDGTEQWLFDGFLFLEFRDGEGHTFTPGYAKKNATRKEWEWYLERLFEKGKSLDALDRVISEKKKKLGDPGFRHKVVLTQFTPIPDQKDWGRVGRRRLDFHNLDDQQIAMQWFTNELVKRFKKAKYKNLDLDGIYWVAESIYASFDVTKEYSDFLHRKGLKFYWIPYHNSPDADRWRDFGFDVVYQQPNYFVDDHIPANRLDETIKYAYRNGMGLEFEVDESAFTADRAGFDEHFKAYMTEFNRTGVYRNSALAYYLGSHIIIDILEQKRPAELQMLDTFARYIVNRRLNGVPPRQ